PGQEGGHADAAGDPDLACLAVLAAEHEAAVGAFDGHRLADRDPAGELAGVVAQGLDLEGEAAVAVVGAGDGEGVRALEALEADEGELPGLVSAPGAVEPADDLGDVGGGRGHGGD